MTELSASALAVTGNGFVYLEKRGQGREEECWCGYVTPEGVTIRYGKVGRALRTQTIPLASCANNTPISELAKRVEAKLQEGYATVSNSPNERKLRKEFESANKAEDTSTQGHVYWSIRGEELSQDLMKMAIDFLSEHAPGSPMASIFLKPQHEVRGSGIAEMKSPMTLILAVLADRLPQGVIGLADDEGRSVTLETLREEEWIKEHEDLAVSLGFIKRPIRWEAAMHPAAAGGWF